MLPASPDDPLRRDFAHAITTLDVCRRRWQQQQQPGKQALSSVVNARRMQAHAEGSDWPSGFAIVRDGVERRATRDRKAADDAIQPVMQELEAIVADMRKAADGLRGKVEAAARRNIRQPPASPLAIASPRSASSSPRTPAPASPAPAPVDSAAAAKSLAERIEATVVAFESELRLRRAVVAELTGAGQPAHPCDEPDFPDLDEASVDYMREFLANYTEYDEEKISKAAEFIEARTQAQKAEKDAAAAAEGGQGGQPKSRREETGMKYLLRSHLMPGWDKNAQLLLSAWVLEPYVDQPRMDLLFESLAAEQAPPTFGTPARRR